MNSTSSKQHFSSHPQESRRVSQTSRVLFHTRRGKVALIGAIALLVATINSSCGGPGGSGQVTPTSTPTSFPTSTLADSPTAIATSTSTPTPTGKIEGRLDVRTGPGTGYGVSFMTPDGIEQVTLLARDSTSSWVEISTSDEQTGWVSVDQITIDPSVSIDSLPVSPIPTNPLPIFVYSLAPGYGMGVNTSGGLTNWVEVVPPLAEYDTGEIHMAYPSGQSWGAVFITVGNPTQPPRTGEDLSRYHQLSLQLVGTLADGSVSIGIKDNTQPDDGTEPKVSVSFLYKVPKTFTFPLSQFTGSDLHKLYVVIEFVFAGSTPETVDAGDIQYLL